MGAWASTCARGPPLVAVPPELLCPANVQLPKDVLKIVRGRVAIGELAPCGVALGYDLGESGRRYGFGRRGYGFGFFIGQGISLKR